MTIAVEITMYPLCENYIPLIDDFLDRINAYSNLTIRTNNMSTRITGNYSDIIQLLDKELKKSFDCGTKISFVMKVLNNPIQDGILDI
jgi:uncharacterized protein YqgV (UPF0045/DUF77 family)